MHYQDMDAKTLLDTVLQEEQTLRFSDFSNAEAYRLGQCIVANFETVGTAAVEIFVNGSCKFRYLPNGTNPNNETFLEKKRRTVEEREMSSLGMYAWLLSQGKEQEDVLMPKDVFCAKGGSFPIRLQGGSVIGSVTVSGLPHFDDHRLVVTSLGDYFK